MKYAKKSLGQNFLIDNNVVKKIINLTDVKNKNVLEMVDKKPDNGFKHAWGALTFNRKLEQYINNQDPHIGYAVKESVNNGEKVSVSLVEGNYFDCGTPEEYIKLLKETLLS